MKVAVILALARYFHRLPLEQINRLPNMIPPALILLVPIFLILRQPDLGTSLVLMIGGISVLFLSGIRLWVFGLGGAGVLAAIPNFMGKFTKLSKRPRDCLFKS